MLSTAHVSPSPTSFWAQSESSRDRPAATDIVNATDRRTAVEHTLAPIGQWQGRDARYTGQRKNRFDLRRTAAAHTLHVLMRQPQPTDAA